MSKVLLISVNTVTDPYPVYPLGMAVVAAAAAARGHTVRQFDLLAAGRSEERLAEAVTDFRPDVVGVSLRNIDSVDSFMGHSQWYLDTARDVVRAVRRVTAAPVVLGGAAFSIMPEAILEYVGGDHGVIGEGERVFPRLVESLARGESVPPLCSGRGEPVAGPDQPSPCFDALCVAFYLEQSGMANLQTKRGCPFRCTYCTYPGLEGHDLRVRQPAAVADDLLRLKRDHGVQRVFFTDSVFNDPAGHYLVLAEELVRRQVGVQWCAFMRPQGIGRPELALLRRAGLYAAEVGTDGASDATLAGLQKGFVFADVVAFQEACEAESVPCAHFVMFGGPGETDVSLREGLANLERLTHAIVFAFSGLRVFPGTGLHDQAVAAGLLARTDPLLEPAYYFSPELGRDAMNTAVETAFTGRVDRVFPPSRGQEKLAVLRRFGCRGLLWDLLLVRTGAGRRSGLRSATAGQ